MGSCLSLLFQRFLAEFLFPFIATSSRVHANPAILVSHSHITIIDESASSNSVYDAYRNDYFFLAHKAAISENRLR
jgi:hypothetical protein